MVEKAPQKPGKHRACKGGPRTAKEHLDAINRGYPMHTWSGPKLKAN